MAKRELKYVGRSVPRVDGIEKVTGQAKFLGDLVVPGMLHGKILRSSYPHARILSIDTSKAEALPGVAAVLTAADLGDRVPTYNGRPVIAANKVRYVGEPLAAVAATDLATAEEAATLIDVQYAELPPVIGIDAARAHGAPLIHEDHSDNICSHERVERGNIQEGFAQSDVVVEDNFTFPMVYHYAMEPHSVIAHWNDEGVTVWSSAQHPFQVRNDIAKIFRIPPSRVRMVISYLGGGYGSKSYTKFEPLVVALARKAHAPVRVCNSVSDSMLTVRRHSAQVRVKTRLQAGRHPDGTGGRDLSGHRRLRRQWAAGDDPRSDASFGPLPDSQYFDQRLLRLHKLRLRGFFSRHRCAAGDLCWRITDRHCGGPFGN